PVQPHVAAFARPRARGRVSGERRQEHHRSHKRVTRPQARHHERRRYTLASTATLHEATPTSVSAVHLYNSAVSGNCYKVRLLLAPLGLGYETVDVSVVDRSNRDELLGGLNPALRVPTLVLDDGRPLAESNAILWYFGDGTAYVPHDPYARAQVLQWLFFE